MEKELIDRIKLLRILNAWDPDKEIVPQFVWDAINGLSVENQSATPSGNICSGYHNGRCWGTSEKCATDCGGDIFKCGFYLHHPLTELYELKKEVEMEK